MSDYGWRDLFWFLRCKAEWWLWVKWACALRRRRSRRRGGGLQVAAGGGLTFRGIPLRIVDKLETVEPEVPGEFPIDGDAEEPAP